MSTTTTTGREPFDVLPPTKSLRPIFDQQHLCLFFFPSSPFSIFSKTFLSWSHNLEELTNSNLTTNRTQITEHYIFPTYKTVFNNPLRWKSCKLQVNHSIFHELSPLSCLHPSRQFLALRYRTFTSCRDNRPSRASSCRPSRFPRSGSVPDPSTFSLHHGQDQE